MVVIVTVRIAVSVTAGAIVRVVIARVVRLD